MNYTSCKFSFLSHQDILMDRYAYRA